MLLHDKLVWIISLATIVCVLVRPYKVQEWAYASGGAILLVVLTLLPLKVAGSALLKGVDVYLFLIGMMMLSETARIEGVFDYVSSQASRHARGSSLLLFFYIYAAGTLVTVFLSNDATAVVLTPAVYSAVKKSGAVARPYLFACAFIANAASFVLPISNPANLVVYQSQLPPIGIWLKTFLIPSLLSITATYLILLLWFRKDLNKKISLTSADLVLPLSNRGKVAFAGIGCVIAALFLASAKHWELGLPTLIAASLVLASVSLMQRNFPLKEIKGISWSVIPLVGGLFVIVEAINRAGALDLMTKYFQYVSKLPEIEGHFSAAFGVGILSNILNNLPVGLMSGISVGYQGISDSVRNAVLIGVDLGPNLSVTGSLATILWLIVLRREGESMSGFSFFAVGLLAMPIALAAAILAL